MVEIFLIVLPVFLVIGLGFMVRGTGLVDGPFLARLNRLVYYVPLPIMFFYKIAQADFSASFNPRLLFSTVLAALAVCLLSYIYGRIRKQEPTELGAFSQSCFRGNLVYVGLPLVYSAYGEEGFAVAGILIGFITPLVNFLSIIVLLLPQQRTDHQLQPSFWIHQIALNPLIVASFLGIIWSIFAIPIPLVLAETFEIISGMALPLALLVIGASFSVAELRGDMMVTTLATGVKLIILPSLTALLLLLTGVTGMEFGVGILLTAAPAASAGYILAQQLKSDGELASSIIMVSTMVSVISYTVYLYLFKLAGF